MDLISQHLDIWTEAQVVKPKGGRGKKAKNQGLYGIKKLRELILELAVRGKLVPQDPNDEPASELLLKIAEEKARLIKEKKIKKLKKLPEIGEDEKPFTLPNGWEWIRLGNTGIGSTGKTPSTKNLNYYGDAVPFVGPGQITISGNIIDSDKTLSREGCTYSVVAESGDILMVCIGGSIGKCAITWSKIAFNQQLNSIHPIDLDSKYLISVLTSSRFQTALLGAASGSATPIINRSKWEVLLVAIPPLAEQHRIVAKVDELMILCDQLEQQQTASNTTLQTLRDTVLTSLTTASNQKEFNQSWQRIATNFHTLFNTEQAIDQLKQTILQLAVMGKLVPQNPKDEPASTLLKKIAQEKATLIKQGKIKKQKELPKISEDEKPFALPSGWAWVRIDDLSLHSEAGWSPKCEPSPREGNEWGVLKVSAVTWGQYNPDENKALPKHLEPRPGCEVMPGDFLISRANTAELVARAVVVPVDSPTRLMMSDKIIRFGFSSKSNPKYLAVANGSLFSRNYYARVAGGTSSSMKNVTRNQIRALVVALPPIFEQHRIVAKVVELMTLCDTLKSRLKENQTTQVTLADTIVQHAVNTPSINSSLYMGNLNAI